MSTCTGCGKEIEWALTEKNARRIPLDPGCSIAGNLLGVEYTAGGTLVVATITPHTDPAARVPHFATCTKKPKRRPRSKR